VRLIAECLGWAVLIYAAWWLLLLTLEITAVILAAKWRPYVRVGRLAVYFGAAGGPGTVNWFQTGDGARFHHKFFLFYWRRER